MNPARFEHIREGHRVALAALEHLEAAREAGRGRVKAAREKLLAAVGVFLERDAACIEEVLRAEESEILAALDAYLPQETESSASLRSAHDTARGLLALLRRERAAALQGAPDAESNLRAAVRDLRLLLREHFRKQDGVVRRLLERLMREKDHD